MKRFRKMSALLLVMVLIVQMAPEAVCKAVESTYNLVIYPETPLDEVYFYSNKTENKKGGYYYGYLDDKIAIMDESYNLVKKTDFNEYTGNTGSISMVKGTPAFVAAKVVGADERIYGILSSAGETIIPAEYAYMGKSMDRTLITVGEKQKNGKILYGVWDSDCKEILPCEYPYAYGVGTDAGRTLIRVKDKDGSGTLLLDGKKFFTEEKAEWEDNVCAYRREYNYCFAEYKGKMYIMIDYTLYREPLDEEDVDKYHMGRDIYLYSYTGELMKKMSEEEYMDYYIYSEMDEMNESDNTEEFNSKSYLGLRTAGSKFIIYDRKTGKDIYTSEKGETEPYSSEKYGQYYFINIYNNETFIPKTMIIDSSSDKVKFYGNKYETYIRINEEDHEIIVFGKRGVENILPSSKPDSDLPVSTEKPVPSQNTDNTEKPDVTGNPQTTVTPFPEGTSVKDSIGVTYTITKTGSSEREVAFTAPKNKKITSITIPDTVILDGSTYKVTSIKANAFKKYKKLKKVTIGKNIKSIGKNAFYGCAKLKSITIKTTKLTKKNVGSKTFAKIHPNAAVKVPGNKLSAYKRLLKKKGLQGKNFSFLVDAKPTVTKAITLTVGQSKKISVEGFAIKKKTFRSSNKKIASVSKNGKVTAKKKGSCKITVTIKYKRIKNAKKYTMKKYVCKVEIKEKAETQKPNPVPTETPKTDTEESENDIKAITKLIREQRQQGAFVSEDLDSEEYVWEYDNDKKKTHLVEIHWEERQLQGEISFGELKSLRVLNCSDNQLTNLDVSKNVGLEKLDCCENQLNKLDVRSNIKLCDLCCSGNQLTSLDVSKNTYLVKLSCGDNQLTRLNVKKNSDLNELYCLGNRLTSLDVSKNVQLTELTCADNQLTKLIVTENVNLKWLYCYGNQLTSLDVSENVCLLELECGNNQLLKLNVTENVNLNWLTCSGNQLTSLDVSQNILLENLDCCDNELSSLVVSDNPVLSGLACDDNKINSIDLTQNGELRYFTCSNNRLTRLDVSKNTLLECLDCSENQIAHLDVGNCSKLESLRCDDSVDVIGWYIY